jgi:hypothetical protein
MIKELVRKLFSRDTYLITKSRNDNILEEFLHLPPSASELEKYPSLKDAWDNYLIIRKLTTGNNGSDI